MKYTAHVVIDEEDCESTIFLLLDLLTGACNKLCCLELAPWSKPHLQAKR